MADKRKKKEPKKGKLTPAENKLFAQEHSDIAKEGKASPSELKKLTTQVQNDQTKLDVLTGMGHPDAKALIAAGIDPSRVQSLANQHAPTHPAADPNAGTGFTESPSSPAQYAADVLKEANLPDTASNEKLLETQMTEEGMPGSENNPLATTLQGQGSSSVNSAGVQQYPTLAEGATEEAATLTQPNMASIFNALKSGTATPQQYADALANSSYEGYNPAANASYANAFLTDSGQPEQNFPTGGGGGGASLGTGASSLANAASTNIFQGLSNVLGSIPTAASGQSLQQALSGLSSNPETATEAANTTNAPGSPDQAASASQKTAVNPASLYQAQLAALIPGLTPGSAGKQ